ncbi:hypothetical protein ACFSQJ_18655 [Croceitalea marina]|uniref:Adhesin domain-containing protein n=1 Tax=Croceitalea marina TaxID=1775166 RepID=A0ABW5N3Z1_9FLAO
MKTLSFLVYGLLSVTTVFAQKIIEKNIPYENQSIYLDVKFAENIDVKTWDKTTVYFKASIYTEDSQFQDFYRLNVEENNDIIAITSEAEGVFKAYRKDCLEKNPSKKRNCYNTGDLTEFKYTLYVPKNAKFKISSINGDLKSDLIEGNFTAELINGNIDIKKYSGALNLSTINGEIDLKITSTSFVAETIHGDIYANEALDIVSQDKHVGRKVWSEDSGAKNRLKLNTINGNMYLR